MLRSAALSTAIMSAMKRAIARRGLRFAAFVPRQRRVLAYAHPS